MSKGEKNVWLAVTAHVIWKKSAQEKTCSAPVSLISDENVMNVSIAWQKKTKKKNSKLVTPIHEELVQTGVCEKKRKHETWGGVLK